MPKLSQFPIDSTPLPLQPNIQHHLPTLTKPLWQFACHLITLRQYTFVLPSAVTLVCACGINVYAAILYPVQNSEYRNCGATPDGDSVYYCKVASKLPQWLCESNIFIYYQFYLAASMLAGE